MTPTPRPAGEASGWSVPLAASLAALVSVAVLLPSPASAQAPTPDLPTAVELLWARPFTLEEPAVLAWLPDQPPLRDGYLAVIEAPLAVCWPRQVAEPLLHAGDVLAAKANHGWPEGKIVILIPGAMELTKLPLWFDEPGPSLGLTLEERQARRAKAEAAGIRPPSQEDVARALAAGGERLVLAGGPGLWPHVDALVREHDERRAASMPTLTTGDER